MRVIAAVLALNLLAGSSAQAADPVATPSPASPATLEAIGEIHDAGRVEAGTRVSHTYELRNHGTKELQIDVHASCGCTTTDYDKTIPPGGTGKVSAALDTTHMRGRTVKTIRVKTNDPAIPAVLLTMVADARRSLDVLPSDVPTLRGPAGMLEPVALTVSAPGGAPFAIRAIEGDPLVAATLEPPQGNTPRKEFHLTLTPRRDLPVGTHSPTLTLVTTQPKAERFDLRPVIVVMGPLTTQPLQLLARSGGAPMSARVHAADGTTTFRVLRVDSTDPDFAATFAFVDDHTWDVSVRYVGKPDRHGAVHAALKVTTDDKRQPVLLIRIGGRL